MPRRSDSALSVRYDGPLGASFRWCGSVPARKKRAIFSVSRSVTCQYTELRRASAILMGVIAWPPMSGRKCSSHSSLKTPDVQVDPVEGAEGAHRI